MQLGFFKVISFLRKWAMRHNSLINARAEAILVLFYLQSARDFLPFFKERLHVGYTNRKNHQAGKPQYKLLYAHPLYNQQAKLKY